MIDLLAQQDLSLQQVQILVRAMHKIAQSDSTHPYEIEMMREFYNACKQNDAKAESFDTLLATPFDGREACETFPNADHKETLLLSCYLLAFADGEVSELERAALRELALDLGFAEDDMWRVEERITDHLMQQLSSTITNEQALAEVEEELRPR